MAKKKSSKKTSVKSALKNVGGNLSLNEVKQVAKATGKDPLTIMGQAVKQGVSLGRKVVAAYNTPGGLGNYLYQGTPSNLQALKGLELGKGQVYRGQTTQTTPSTRNVNSGYSPGSTTYTPVIGMKGEGGKAGKGKGMSTSGGGGGGGGAGGGGRLSKRMRDLLAIRGGGAADIDTGAGPYDGMLDPEGPNDAGGPLAPTDVDPTEMPTEAVPVVEEPVLEEPAIAETDPLQFAQLGRSYFSDAIRARMRRRRERTSYLRNLRTERSPFAARMAGLTIGGLNVS
jgi:hypothetical protein